MTVTLRMKLKEAIVAVLPITAILALLSVTIAPMPTSTLLLFLAGAVLLIAGMAFFTYGVDLSMLPVGEQIGEALGKSKRPVLALLIIFLIGGLITLAEPDLQVLAHQIPGIPDMVMVVTVAIGVGLFLLLAYLRTKFHLVLTRLLFIFYPLVFLLAFFAPPSFRAIAFDSGGVTTGPITVPFLMAMGIGLAASSRGTEGHEGSFGMVALCSIGPILAVLLLGLFYQPDGGSYQSIYLPELFTTKEVAKEFVQAIPTYLLEVALALIPILLFILLFGVVKRHFQREQIRPLISGALYTFLGLVLFLTGVNIGFLPVGHYVGMEIAKLPYRWILIPISMVIGYFIVAAEPAVQVLNEQVEALTEGAIPRKAMMTSLACGISLSLGLSMTRVLFGLSLFYFLIPGYILALGLSLVVPKIFTAIAFDSGGVASGPMTATFLLPFAMGACEALGGELLTDAFGIVAMVAMTPLITIQLLGLIYRFRRDRAPRPEKETKLSNK